MASLETGRVCMKVVGREAGRYCVVMKSVNKSFALVNGPKILTGVKKRNANIAHLEPTEYKLEINENSTDGDIIAAMNKIGLITKLDLRMPSAAEMKAKAEKKEEKAEQKETKEEKKKKEFKGKEKK